VSQKAIILSFFCEGRQNCSDGGASNFRRLLWTVFFYATSVPRCGFQLARGNGILFFRERNGISLVRLLRMQSDGSLAAKQHGRPVSLAETGRDAVPSWKVVLSWFFFYYHPLDQI
jgi:hypothetical protein